MLLLAVLAQDETTYFSPVRTALARTETSKQGKIGVRVFAKFIPRAEKRRL